MILVDTSIWIEHLRRGDERLARILEQGQVLSHPYVISELALGSLRNRERILGALQDLPQTSVPTDDEVLRFVEQNALYDVGIGYIDVHLLAAVRLSPGTTLWTGDKRLLAAGKTLGLIENRLQ
jgi:predicted nucleic acid-binding protein